MERIWLDTTVLAVLPKETLEELAREGYTLVIANTAIDVKHFQEDPTWVESMLNKKQLIIEMWLTLDQMTAKPFYWSSFGVETPASASFEEAVSYLPDAEKVLALADIIDHYGIPRGKWTQGAYTAPTPLSIEDSGTLGVDTMATRTEILKAAQQINKMHIYDRYNVGYCRGLATQHRCDYMLCTDASLAKI